MITRSLRNDVRPVVAAPVPPPVAIQCPNPTDREIHQTRKVCAKCGGSGKQTERRVVPRGEREVTETVQTTSSQILTPAHTALLERHITPLQRKVVVPEHYESF